MGIHQMMLGAGGQLPTPTIDVLVVAGGGGVAHITYNSCYSGGGGAGGMCEQTGRSVSAGVPYSVTVGAGGAVGSENDGQPGGNSVFGTITAFGGSPSVVPFGTVIPGGSGAGGSSERGTGGSVGSAATQTSNGGATGYGFAGSAGDSDTVGGGGGGAGGPGVGPDNGPGRSNSITGSAVVYAKGGTAGGWVAPASPVPNSGNGGGGGIEYTPGAAGSSGVVIIRYPNTYAEPSSITGSVVDISYTGYRCYKWTSGSGSVTF